MYFWAHKEKLLEQIIRQVHGKCWKSNFWNYLTNAIFRLTQIRANGVSKEHLSQGRWTPRKMTGIWLYEFKLHPVVILTCQPGDPFYPPIWWTAECFATEVNVVSSPQFQFIWFTWRVRVKNLVHLTKNQCSQVQSKLIHEFNKV